MESSSLEGLQSKVVSGELLNTHCDEGTEMWWLTQDLTDWFKSAQQLRIARLSP